MPFFSCHYFDFVYCLIILFYLMLWFAFASKEPIRLIFSHPRPTLFCLLWWMAHIQIMSKAQWHKHVIILHSSKRCFLLRLVSTINMLGKILYVVRSICVNFISQNPDYWWHNKQWLFSHVVSCSGVKWGFWETMTVRIKRYLLKTHSSCIQLNFLIFFKYTFNIN